MIINPDRRGRTRDGRHTYRPLIQYEPGDYPPDSLYWQRWFRALAYDVIDKIGLEAYGELLDSFPEPEHWRHFYDLLNQAYTNLVESESVPSPTSISSQPDFVTILEEQIEA